MIEKPYILLLLSKLGRMNGTVYLIPSAISECDTNDILPQNVKNLVHKLHHFIVENERTARRFLIHSGYSSPIDNITFYILDKHTTPEQISTFLKPTEQGVDIGILSEAGAPAVADPGAVIVRMAHQKGIRVKPLTGPSSILMALMASGMNGQSFAFHGYLPIDKKERSHTLHHLEKISASENQTQVFIETPFRNQQILSDIITHCATDTQLGIACNITAPDEFIQTHPVGYWKTHPVDIQKKPAVFMIYRDNIKGNHFKN